MEYHVLSNGDIISILKNVAIVTFFMWPLFSYLASRDASNKKAKNGLTQKIIPWALLCVFLSDVALLVSKLYDYPWDIDAIPSQASAYREMQYLPTGFVLYGWANDYQLPILSSLSGAVLWFCWTVYAFYFKPSDTSWWKKTCKVIAYIIISITIFGFQLHQYGDLWGYAMLLVVVIALLWIAHVKPEKKEVSTPDEAIIESSQCESEDKDCECSPATNGDPSRFMPKVAILEEVIESTSIEESKPKEHVEEAHEAASMPSKTIQETIVDLDTASVNEQIPNNEVFQTIESDMMYCKHCGKRIESDSTFCKYCGIRL